MRSTKWISFNNKFVFSYKLSEIKDQDNLKMFELITDYGLNEQKPYDLADITYKKEQVTICYHVELNEDKVKYKTSIQGIIVNFY